MSRKIAWPPVAAKRKGTKARQENRDGEASWVPLQRYDGDRTLSGRLFNACCDCGLDHLLTFNVVRQDNGQWWLVKRAYRIGNLGRPLK